MLAQGESACQRRAPGCAEGLGYVRCTALGVPDDLGEDGVEAVAAEHRVLKGGVQVHRVVVLAAFAAYPQHVGAAQVTDEAPDGAAGEGHSLRDLLYGAVRVGGDEEEDGAVTGEDIPVVFDGHVLNSDSSSTIAATPYYHR